MNESKIIPCYEVPADFEAKGPFDLPCEGPIPPTLRKVGVGRVIGRTILDALCHLGSYGMGGPGFLGLELEKNSEHSTEWLVLCLWGCDEWVLCNGKPIYAVDKTWDTFGQAKFREYFKGAGKIIKSFDITDKSCKITVDDTILEITEDPKKRPPYGGNGEPRVLETDSLWDAWVISSTMYIAI